MIENAKDKIKDAFEENNPMVFSTSIPNSINNESQTVNFEPFSAPVYRPKPEAEAPELEGKTPGIVEGIIHEWKNWSLVGSNIKAYEKGQALKPANDIYENPSDDPIPDNWTPFENRDYYLNVSRDWWDTLFLAKSPKDQEARFNFARQEMAKEEYFSRGSIMQKIVSKSLGIPGGIVIDPYNLLPFAASMKYLKISQNFLKNAVKVAPSLGAINVGKELINYDQDPDETIANAGYHAVRDTMAGMFLIAGMQGLGRGYEGYKLYRLRNSGDFNREGIGFKFDVGDKGEIKGYTAYSMPNEAMSAMRVTRAQEYADSQFARTGLFWLPKVTNLAGVLSPIIRGLNSSYGSIRALTNRLVDHDINTVGGNKHVPDSTSFEKRLMDIEGDAASFGVKMEGLRKAYNGIDLTVDEEEALKKLNSTLNKKDPYDPASFGRRVASAVITDSSGQGLQINEAKKLWDDFAQKYWNRYQRALGFREETLPLATAKGYLTQVYNRVAMAANEEGWTNAVALALKDQDKIIRELTRPIDELNLQIKEVKAEILAGNDLENNRLLLKELRGQKKTERDALIETLRDNQDYSILLRERNLLSSKEAEGLRETLKPLKALKKDQLKVKDELTQIKKTRASLIKNLETPRKKKVAPEVLKKQHAEIKAKIEEIDKEIARFEEEINSFEYKILNEEAALSSRAMAGELPDNYFYRHHETGQVIFRDPNKLPKFRDLYIDDDDMRQEAKSLYESIMNLSDEEVMNHRVTELSGVISENPLYKRTVMIPSEVFLNNNFLVTDMPAIANNYALGIGKSAALNEALEGFGIGRKGVDGVFELLGKEYQDNLKKLNGLEGKEHAKQLEKITKKFNKEKQFAKDLLDAMMGFRQHDKYISSISRDIRNLAASTKLGFVPLTQIADTMANVFKHGIWRFIRDGFAPSLRSLNGQLRGKNAENVRRTASEANLTLEHFRGGMVRKFYGYDSYGELAPQNKLSAGLQSAANFSGNLSGMNYIENFNQRLSAGIVDSKIMELMHKFQNGTLSTREAKELSRMGLDPEIWAEPFIKQFNEHGIKGVFGGYDSYFYNWTNRDAKLKMAQTIHTSVRNLIVRRGRADMPLIFNNPVLSLVTQFMGWGFASFNRFTVPLLQRGDANAITGTILMAMVASMEGVTRKIARGEEVDFDDENFMAEAFSNSAPFAMLYKSAMFANQFLDNDFLTSMQNDKQRAISQLGMISGAGFGVIKDYAKVLSMIGSNDYNKQDIAKLVRAIPGTQAWYLYQIQQKFIDAATEGLPERRTPKG